MLGGVALAAAIAFGIGAQNVARDIVERAYERRRDQVMSAPAEREFSTQGDSVPRTRPPCAATRRSRDSCGVSSRGAAQGSMIKPCH